MIYKKITTVAFIIAIVATIISSTVLGTNITSNDEIYDGFFEILLFIQKYSWPVIILFFIYALYEFYIIGTEVPDHKFKGQRMIVGIAIFTAIFQCLPLIYAFIITA